MRKSKSQKEKVLLSIKGEVLDELNKFVGECDNPKVNRSVIVEDILEEILLKKEHEKILNKLFPYNKK